MSSIKFFIKIRVVGTLRSLVLLLFGSSLRAQTTDILIINLEGIGDMVAFTGVLKHYRAAFRGRKISLLMRESYGLEVELAEFVDEIIVIRYGSFVRNPWYAYQLIKKLRAHGFQTVIAHDHAVAEPFGKIIALSLGSRETIAYEGFRLQYEKPLNASMRMTSRYVTRELFPRFTRVIPTIALRGEVGALQNVIDHYRWIYESIVGSAASDYAPTLPAIASIDPTFKEYAVLNLGSSQAWKNWPVSRFVAVAQTFRDRNIPIVLIGSRAERALAEIFKERYDGTCLDLVGKLSIAETVAYINKSKVVLSNDTSAIHMAVACQRPSIAILGGGHVGSNSHYGYEDINIWVYAHTHCFLDNWRCTVGLSKGSIAPCIEAVSEELVRNRLISLLDYLDQTSHIPQRPFSISFFKNS